jgi:exopolysaccharide biosynthesis polyprenyl glycosylphosphotransferase
MAVKRPDKSHIVTAILVASDVAAFCAIWFSMYYLRDYLATVGIVGRPINPVRNYILALQVYLPLWLMCEWYYGNFDHREKLTGLNQLSRILKTFIAGLVGSLAFAYLFKQWDIGRFILLSSSVLYFWWLYLSRSLLKAWKQAQVLRGEGVIDVLVIGVGRTARRVMDRIVNHPEGGYRLIGFVDPHPRRPRRAINGFPVLGSTRELVKILREHPVQQVFLAVPKMPQNEMMNLIVQCEDEGVQFKIVTNLFEVITSQVRIDVIDEVPVIHLRNAELPFVQAVLKRVLDIVVASALLVVFAPVMLGIAIAIRLDSRGPALFKQVRVGQHGKLFEMYKFRTMYVDADPYAPAPTDPNDPRITRIGRWLRRYSLDEFPQLFNVLRGEMSMVGPRPEMPFLVEQYEEWQRRRLDVKPGVTGLWQIVGRKNLPLSLNLEYDFYYIKNQSLFFDIVILLKTIPAVIFGKGAF